MKPAPALRRAWHGLLLLIGLVLLAEAGAEAHPVPRLTHDRTIVVRLTHEGVVVDYRLEIDDWTIVFLDLPAVDDKVDLKKLRKPQDFYEAFTRCYAPILAGNLSAKLDGKELTFRCVTYQHEVLDHVRCDFRFQADWQLSPGQLYEFALREENYQTEAGMIRLSLADSHGVQILGRIEPDEALKGRPAAELKPGDETRLRRVSAKFQLGAAQPRELEASAAEPAAPSGGRSFTLWSLLDSSDGFWMVLVLAAFFGAAHALTPGHGKTLVAAYLVGERGTVWHALLLGLVTTLTHTGVVIALAVICRLFPGIVPSDLQTVLAAVGGLLAAGFGFWLLLQRLAGRADHVHLGGHSHHHYHPGDHGHTHALPASDVPVGWRGLVVLGVSGGIVPCWDAIFLLGLAVMRGQLALALPLILAFSAGLAGVLVATGILVVSAKQFVARWESKGPVRRLVRALPLVSAAFVTGLGLWACYEGLHPPGTPPPPAASARP
jgi:ABC-type nickel/cobalt efflux system permease component RcnA